MTEPTANGDRLVPLELMVPARSRGQLKLLAALQAASGGNVTMASLARDAFERGLTQIYHETMESLDPDTRQMLQDMAQQS